MVVKPNRGCQFIMYAPWGGGHDHDTIGFSYLCNVEKVHTGGSQIWPKNAYIINGQPHTS
jgi:hypothetical protein